MKKYFFTFWISLIVCMSFVILLCPLVVLSAAPAFAQEIKSETYNDYLNYFEEVYSVMEDNYYKNIRRSDFDKFIVKFKKKIFNQLKSTGKSVDYIKWRSASFLVKSLKAKEDIFSELYPPKPAKEYEQTALGKRIDLGIEGKLTDKGFVTLQVEPRSDAYSKGMRISDIVLQVDDNKVVGLTEKEVRDLLTPLEESKVKIRFYSNESKSEKEIEVVSKEYFKQTVFLVPVRAPDVYCLKIQRFNRKTPDDMFRFIQFIKAQGKIKGLILDLRDNPGGPPLAAQEIASFFLQSGEEFTYFQKKGEPKAVLDVPSIPKSYHYDGPLVILVNKESGSASELFSGILQKKGRAVLMGTRTAGQVMLKSMFHLKDDAMLLLITARGHYPDGSVFSFDGLMPNKLFKVSEEVDLINYASIYFLYLERKKS